jgi:hypothetical protein
MSCTFSFQFQGDNKWINGSSYMKSGTEIDRSIHIFRMKQLIVNNYEHGDSAHFWAYAKQI